MTVDRAPRAEGFTTFAWQGISLTVPPSWNLVFTQGDARAGNVRLADENVLRLEMRWQAGGADASPGAMVDSYVAALRKRASKEAADLVVQRDLRLAAPPDADVECYRWTADRQALAMLRRCKRCGRVVHVHLLGRPDEQLKGLARTVFASLRDHSDDGTLLWKFLDVEFRTPARLSLSDRSLQSGCVRMGFSRGLTKIEFVRVSLAEVLLARASLADWFRGFYAKSLKRRSFGISEARWKGHAGLEVTGRVWLVVNPSALVGRRRIVHAACWHCDATNRIFICAFDGPAREAGLFPQAVEGFTCCAQ